MSNSNRDLQQRINNQRLQIVDLTNKLKKRQAEIETTEQTKIMYKNALFRAEAMISRLQDDLRDKVMDNVRDFTLYGMSPDEIYKLKKRADELERAPQVKVVSERLHTTKRCVNEIEAQGIEKMLDNVYYRYTDGGYAVFVTHIKEYANKLRAKQ